MSGQSNIFIDCNATAPSGRNRPIRSHLRLNASELSDTRRFREFNNQIASGHCSLCMRVLYPEEQKFRPLEEEFIICTSWNINPIVNANGLHMVCSFHYRNDVTSSNLRENSRREAEGQDRVARTSENFRNQYVYPGDLQPLCSGLNYRELSILSPIKLMTQMTRKGTLSTGRIGHYVVKGSVFTTHNFEFAEMAYGGVLGLFFQKGEIAGINKNKVKLAYAALQATHPLLSRYSLEKLTNSLVNYHVNHSRDYVGQHEGFRNNMLMPLENPHSEAAGHKFADLIIGTDVGRHAVRYGHPSLIALLFPYLYTTCTGHYSMCNVTPEILDIEEQRGGVARAKLENMTLADYAKSRLLMRDRRFGKDPSFLFFMMDAIEKNNISGANLRVAHTRNLGRPRQRDFVTTRSDGSKAYKRSESSIVPPSIRTSYAYHRRNHSDVKTIFHNLGEPQLFLTFTCEDTASYMKNATGCDRPWEDPILFAYHFKRKWHEFFSKYLLKKWGRKIGGIRDYSWVMEIQDRGSPHIHCVLWTEKTVEQLIELNLISCVLPDSSTDPDLYQLVCRHQIHSHNIRYCKMFDGRRCRFGFPKEPNEVTQFQDETCFYERGVADENVNNYNPYLLSLFRGNMDVQYNKGSKAAYYLAKYITKFDEVVDATLKRKNVRGRYNHTTNVTAMDHFKARTVGSIEAAYHICGWHHHGNSRSVEFLPINLPGDERRALRTNILELNENDTNIFLKSLTEKYENREGAFQLTLPQFFCYYTKAASSRDLRIIKNMIESNTPFPTQTRPWYCNNREQLPIYVICTIGNYSYKYKLKQRKESFWRTFPYNESDGESYYYQQIVINYALPRGRTFVDVRGEDRSWRDFFRELVDERVIIIPNLSNVDNINQVSDEERGVDVAKQELAVMYQQSFPSQKKIFLQAIRDLKLDSTVFVSGAAGTGKSFLLKMLERYYRIHGYHVFKMAPTGVAAHNINGQTMHRFFGITSEDDIVEMTRLRSHIEIYKKSVFLIDEYSMISKSLLDKIHSALLKTTRRNSPMGGIRTIFFGDFAQLPPVLKGMSLEQARSESLWLSSIYKYSNRYNLVEYIRQRDEGFLEILEMVRTGDFNVRVTAFIISRTVRKDDLPLNCLRLYTEREFSERANESDLLAFPGDEIVVESWDYYNCSEQSAWAALRETRLLRQLRLKVGIPVMLLQNIDVDAGWVNGTIATVFYVDDNNVGLKKTVSGNVVERWIQRVTRTVTKTSYSRKQFPIIPAFAATIHKAQSATIDCVAIHLDNMKDHGQLYVAMSRVRYKENLYFFGVDMPVKTKKRFRVDWDANEIVHTNLKRGKM